MKILLDEMLSAAIAEQLRKRRRDAAAVQGDPDLEGKSDLELLRAARELQRVLVTDNVQDFARLHQQFVRTREDHAGIILASPTRFPRSKKTIRLWVNALDRYVREHGEQAHESLCNWLS